MIRQTPAWLNTDEWMKIAPDREKGRFRQIDFNLVIRTIVVQADDGLLQIQWLNEKRAGKLEGLERHGTTFGSEVRGFAAEEIIWSDMAAEPSFWKQDTSIFNRAYREPRMQAKTKMRRPIHLQVLEREPNLETILHQTVIQREIHFPGILRLFDAIAGQTKLHRGTVVTQNYFWIGELLGSEKTVVSTANFLALIQ